MVAQTLSLLCLGKRPVLSTCSKTTGAESTPFLRNAQITWSRCRIYIGGGWQTAQQGLSSQYQPGSISLRKAKMTTLHATPTLLQVATSVSSFIPTCTTAIPDENGYVPPESCNANYGFYPRWQDNLAFALAFGVTTTIHLSQAIIFRKVMETTPS